MISSLESAQRLQKEFETRLLKYSIQEYYIPNRDNQKSQMHYLEKVIVLEDSLVLFLHIDEYKQGYFDDFHQFVSHNSTYTFIVEEITYNNLNFICKEDYYRPYWQFHTSDVIEYIDNILPNIQIKNRINLWSGIPYYIIIYEVQDSDGVVRRANAYTSQPPMIYVSNICKKYIKTGNFFAQRNGGTMEMCLGKIPGSQRVNFIENNLKYFYVKKEFKIKDEVWKYADIVLELANKEQYNQIPRYSYQYSIQRWKNEDRVLQLTSQIYKDYVVIPQYKPYFLKSSFGGQMSYDVYINKLNIAIEYQGKQHFEPVDFFGGEESFEKQVLRDKEKKELSKQYGVKLVYINFDEEITPELITSRVSHAILEE